MSKITRLINTVKYLRPIQFLYRIKNIFHFSKKHSYSNVKHKNVNLYIPAIHSNKDYLQRFELSNESIDILHQWVRLDCNKNDDYSPLIKFNFQYFEYAIKWAQTNVPFSTFKSFLFNYLLKSFCLEPYVISLQIPNLVIAMNVYGVDDQDIYDEIYSRYRWLIRHQEKHLLANHYFENLKAIVICAYIFNENDVYKKYIHKLKNECNEEILNDGVHFELSLMYHKIILEDLLLVNRVCKESWIEEKISSMLNAAYSLERGFGRTPLFNDSGDNVAKPIFSLIDACRKELGIMPTYTNSFKNSGYYKIDDGKMSILIDAGYAGPKYNPGHAHCDCLSFELFLDNKPIFVNCGTFEYQGAMRNFYRSTRAHNTVMVSNHEQSDFWGEHRLAKRIKKMSGLLDGKSFYGSFKNQYGEKHIREINMKNGVLTVADCVITRNRLGLVKSYLHLAPGFCLKDGCIIGRNTSFVLKTIDCSVSEEDSWYSPDFGKSESIKCLVFKWIQDDKKHGYTIIFHE